MKKHSILTICILILSINISCDNTKSKRETVSTNDTISTNNLQPKQSDSDIESKNKLTDFVPKNYVIFDKIYGDLNKDGSEDCVIIVKGTDKNKIVNDEYRGKLDRNRRGIIVLFNNNGSYELATANYNCLSSENEDGGVYYSPELDFEIKKGNLYVNYAHGRYGYWNYTFRYQNDDMEMIGYDSSDHNGPIVLHSTSINYITKKKIEEENINQNVYDGEEIFKKTESTINRTTLRKLSEIKDFDELRMNED